MSKEFCEHMSTYIPSMHDNFKYKKSEISELKPMQLMPESISDQLILTQEYEKLGIKVLNVKFNPMLLDEN